MEEEALPADFRSRPYTPLNPSTPQPLAAASQTSNTLLSQSLNRIHRESLKTQLRDHVRAVKGEIGFTATPSLPLNLGTVSSVTVYICHKRGV
jgi:hypothetical protein